MIPSYISPGEQLEANEIVAVIDAGGTNLRTCTLCFSDKEPPVIGHFQKQPMPGSKGPVTSDDFFGTIADALEPYIDLISRIGFCFSYDTQIDPDLDGHLLYWSKEIQMPDLVGMHIGKGLQKELNRRGHGSKKIVILNDTVATLLAGYTARTSDNKMAYVGFILGTGMNSAYIEQNSHIGKVPGLQPVAVQSINVESGNYSALTRGPFDLEFDQASDNPGLGVLEKMMSGAYFGDLALLIFREAVQAGHMSPEFGRFLDNIDTLPIMHLDNYVSENGRDTGVLAQASPSPEDQACFLQIVDALTDRAALFSAINIAAASIKGSSAQHCTNVCINIDGSTFHLTKDLSRKAEAYLQRLMSAHGLNYCLVNIDDSPVIGAAVATSHS
jgi:hexokinase